MTSPFSTLFSPKNHVYSSSQVTDNSYYDDPITFDGTGGVIGNSRISGDASAATQEASINAVIQAAASAELDAYDTALLLSILRHESGFNPDAAAGPTSATGLGQFTDATRTTFGLDDADMWNPSANQREIYEK